MKRFFCLAVAFIIAFALCLSASASETDSAVFPVEKETCTHTNVKYDHQQKDDTVHLVLAICEDCGSRVGEFDEEHVFIADKCGWCGLQVTQEGEEGATPPVDEGENQTPTEGENEPPEDDGFTISQFFEEKVLPLLISAGSAIVMFIGALVPYIKKSGKFKRLQGVYTATKAENAKYAELLASVDFEKFKEAIETVLTEDLKKKIAELGNYDGQFEDMKAKMEILLGQMQAMRDGAMNAWAQSPAAVAALSVSPTETAVRRLAKQNAAFENYIKAQKGEEAEEIIAELKGESHDEQGNVSAV